MTLIDELRKTLRRQRISTALIISVSASISLWLVTHQLTGADAVISGLVAVAVCCLLTGIYYRAGSFSLPPSDVIFRYLDRTYPEFEESSALLKEQNPGILETLQVERIKRNLSGMEETIRVPSKRLSRAAILSLALLVVAGFLTITPSTTINTHQTADSVSNLISSANEERTSKLPVIESVEISVSPPDYTRMPEFTERSGNVAAIALSDLTWVVTIQGQVEEASLVFNNKDRLQLSSNGSSFNAELQAENRLIYRIMASSADTTVYSDYFSIDVTEDRPPQFRITSPGQFRTLLTETNREVEMTVEIRDDFGVTEAGLNATLARGSGESVRFREQRMPFDQIEGIGTDRVTASMMIHADSLELTPGDELYLHTTATDNHPDAQTSRSETYMIVLEDTTRSQPLLAGNIQIDLMPEDFRSQRQIIVDTEELIEEKDRIGNEQFRIRSRRIGRDQEMLMLDFGHYLGMEEESVLVSGVMDDGAGAGDHGHGHSHEHDHDHGGESGGVVTEPELDGEGQETSRSTMASVIPDEFFHDHGSPEMNTLFAESPRALLTRALNEMFQASRFLLMDQPEEALAYGYRALEFLQQAQQADRRYVRRAGLDGIPIPVDEDRLTGEVDDFADPGSSMSSGRTTPPLVLLEQQLRENQLFDGDEMMNVTQIINQADISESDKLYLLNRVGRLGNETEDSQIREQLISRLSEINSALQRYPSPVKVPVLQTMSLKR